MEEEKIKKSFFRVKQDIFTLGEEISKIRFEIHEIKQILESFHNNLNTQILHKITKDPNSTIRHITSTHPETSTQTSTVPLEIEGLKYPNLDTSIRNQGASTDRQTDRQTDTSTHNLIEKSQETQKTNIEAQKTITTNPQKPLPNTSQNLPPNISEKHQESIETNIQEASEILESLDNLKKEIRKKFKRVTPREMAVFSAIYQLEEQNIQLSNYKQISTKLSLSESSIRDYVQRMISKGIPIKKQKIDNKKLILSISPELKKIATLSTIIQLREL